MAITANFSSYSNYITDSLHQWDRNQVLTIRGLNLPSAPEVHFYNKSMDRSLVRQTTMDNHVIAVNVPNTILQAPFRIYADFGIYEGSTFKVVETVEIPIIPRPRPCDYVFEDTDGEVYSFNRLENMIENRATKAQVANIVAGVSTDSELVDVRYGADGKTYPSAGEAVREQMSRLFEKINFVETWLPGGFVRHTDGAIVTNAEYSYTDYIAVRNSGENLPIKYRLSLGGYGGIALFDEDKKYLYGIGPSQTLTLETLEGVINDGRPHYARFTCYTSNLANARVELASPVDMIGSQDVTENPCDYTGDDITVFTKGLCIGDSLTEGTVNYSIDGDDGNYISYDKYSYPRNLERMTGIEVTNMGLGGVSTDEWYAAKSGADLSGHDFAVIQLGVNDVYRHGSWTAASENALRAIVAKLQNENKNIKIFVSTIIPASSYSGTAFDAVSAGIRNTVAGLNDPDVILLDMAKHGHTKDSEAYNCGHLSAYGYNRLARDYKAYISWYIDNHKNLFREVQFIGTEYSYQ